MRTLIIEDHKYISNLLTRSFGEITVSVTNLTDARKFLKEDKYDLIIIDVNLKDENGLDFIEELRKTDRETEVIFFTAEDDRYVIEKAISLGIAGYFLKDDDEEPYYKKGSLILSSTVKKILCDEPILSEREREINYWYNKRRLSQKALADKIFRSVDTVKTHCRNIKSKLDKTNLE